VEGNNGTTCSATAAAADNTTGDASAVTAEAPTAVMKIKLRVRRIKVEDTTATHAQQQQQLDCRLCGALQPCRVDSNVRVFGHDDGWSSGNAPAWVLNALGPANALIPDRPPRLSARVVK
jgi:hypothetical protein